MSRMRSSEEKLFVQYPNFRSSTYKYDPCVINKSTLKCGDCRVQIISERMAWFIVISMTARMFNILCTTLELEWAHVHLPSSGAVVIVIRIVAVAEALLASLLIVSSLGTLVSATEMSVSLKPSRINPTRRIARVTIVTSLFTSSPS